MTTLSAFVRRRGFLAFVPALLLLSGCGSQQNSLQIPYKMGEKVKLGTLTYNVVEATWADQLGDGFKIRTPQQRFLLVNISVTNGGGKEVALPLLSLEDEHGKTITESENPEGVPNGIGILRVVAPAQTLQGSLLFDVPLDTYKLRLTDGGEPGSEKFAMVDIPLRMQGDSIQAPVVPVPHK
jgi:hypothetical protein